MKFTTFALILLCAHWAFAQDSEPGFPCDREHTYCATIPDGLFTPNAFSVAARVKTEKNEDSYGAISVGAPSQFFTLYVFRNATRMLVEEDREKNAYAFALAPPPKPGEWVSLIGTYDGEKIKIYRDGALVGERAVKTRLERNAFDGKTLQIGAADRDGERPLRGRIDDLAIWNRALSQADAARVAERGALAAQEGRVALWNADSLSQDGERLTSLDETAIVAERLAHRGLLNAKDSGYRGLWYYNQKVDREYVYKYSGGLGTYCANHYPFAVYRPEVDKTFFCYGGTDLTESTLLHEVGVFDHKTGKVARPTILLDKKTTDAHDNPVLSVDDAGYIWVFSTSHGVSRPSFIHRSVRPYDVSEFERLEPTKIVDGKPVPMTNFSYVQVWNARERGFVAFFTTYDKRLVANQAPDSQAQRILAIMESRNGVEWSEWRPLAAVEIGHYQNAQVCVDPEKRDVDGKPIVKLATVFNYHPAVAKGERGVGLNWRTNLYYIESLDFGKTWRTIQGEPVETPILTSDSQALVRDYEAENLNVYITDLNFDAQGRPIVAFVTSKGFEPGPEMGPRVFRVARWNGREWEISDVCEVDNNYEYADFYLEDVQDGTIRLVGSFDDGPQTWNTGGEISQWISRDFGKTWKKEFQLTEKSERNQCFPRRTIDANPGFYAFWADGNGREKSISNLRFSTKNGEVYELPRVMKDDWEQPMLVRKAPKLD